MKLLIAIYCILITSCATHLKGDLSSKKIASSTDKKISFEQIAKNTRGGIAVVGGEKYRVEYKYDISGIGNGVAPYFTMFTLGIVPFYSTNNADIDLVVKKKNVIILEDRLDSRFHTTYGWLAISAAEKNNSKDLMNWHEGDSIQNQMIETLDERLGQYLKLKLR